MQIGVATMENSMEIPQKTKNRASLVVQWLRLCASIARGTGSIPGQGTKIPYAAWCGQKNPQIL